MTARLLLVVEDTLLIQGRGLVPVPGFVPQGDERFRVGDPLKPKRPDGSTLDCRIAGLEMMMMDPSSPHINDVFILLKGLTKEDVPIGTEFWSVDP